MVCQPNESGHEGTLPTEGLIPTILQKLAGFRNEPPKSVPSARETMPLAKATAAPPEEPPQVLLRSYGLGVAPKTALKVWLPAPNSGVLVFPKLMAPAFFKRSTGKESISGTKSL